MKKASKLLAILTEEFTEPINEKYGKVVIQVATLEERIKTFKDFGLMDRARELNEALIMLLEEIKKEYEKDRAEKEKRKRK